MTQKIIKSYRDITLTLRKEGYTNRDLSRMNKEERIAKVRELGYLYDPPAAFGTNVEVTERKVKPSKLEPQLVKDEQGNVVAILEIPEYTYEERVVAEKQKKAEEKIVSKAKAMAKLGAPVAVEDEKAKELVLKGFEKNIKDTFVQTIAAKRGEAPYKKVETIPTQLPSTKTQPVLATVEYDVVTKKPATMESKVTVTKPAIVYVDPLTIKKVKDYTDPELLIAPRKTATTESVIPESVLQFEKEQAAKTYITDKLDLKIASPTISFDVEEYTKYKSSAEKEVPKTYIETIQKGAEVKFFEPAEHVLGYVTKSITKPFEERQTKITTQILYSRDTTTITPEKADILLEKYIPEVKGEIFATPIQAAAYSGLGILNVGKMIVHPVKSLKGIVYTIYHPIETTEEMVKDIYKEPGKVFMYATEFYLIGKAAKSVGEIAKTVKIESFEVPTLGGKQALYKGVSLEAGGRAQPLVGMKGSKLVLFTPKVDLSILEGRLPIETATQAKIIARSVGGDIAQQINLGGKILRKTKNVAERVGNKKLPTETARLTPEATKVVYEFAKAEDATIFGSVPQQAGVLKQFQRTPGDIDIFVKGTTEEAIKKTEALVKNIQKKGEKARIEPGEPTHIQTYRKGNWEKALEIKTKEMATADLLSGEVNESVLGLNIEKPNVKYEGVMTTSLSEQGLRKGASVYTLTKEAVSKYQGLTKSEIAKGIEFHHTNYLTKEGFKLTKEQHKLWHEIDSGKIKADTPYLKEFYEKYKITEPKHNLQLMPKAHRLKDVPDFFAVQKSLALSKHIGKYKVLKDILKLEEYYPELMKVRGKTRLKEIIYSPNVKRSLSNSLKGYVKSGQPLGILKSSKSKPLEIESEYSYGAIEKQSVSLSSDISKVGMKSVLSSPSQNVIDVSRKFSSPSKISSKSFLVSHSPVAKISKYEISNKTNISKLSNLSKKPISNVSSISNISKSSYNNKSSLTSSSSINKYNSTIPSSSPTMSPSISGSPIKSPSYTIPPPLPSPPPPPPTLKYYNYPREKKEVEGYNTYMIEEGKEVKANVQPLPMDEADRLGRDIADNSLSASYRISKTNNKVPASRRSKLATGIDIPKTKFRQGKSKKYSMFMIEKRNARLDTRGEKEGITAAKLIAQRKQKVGYKTKIERTSLFSKKNGLDFSTKKKTRKWRL